MWTEQTIINPEAWSAQVEYDLTQSIRRQLGVTLDDPEKDIVGAFVEGADEAFTAARAQLVLGSGPQIVDLAPNDAGLTVFPVPSPAERELHETLHDSARFAALQEAALLERIVQIRRNNAHQVIEREARMHEWLNAEEEALGAQLREISGGATAPAFSATPNIGSGLVSATLDTSLTAPTNITTILTAGASGTQIFEIVVEGVGTTVAAVLNLFAYDGAAYNLYDQVSIPAVTSSTTAVAFGTRRQYANFVPKTGWSLRIAQTVAGNQSLIKVTANGGDL